MNKYQDALDNLVHCKSETKCKECRHKDRCTMDRDYKILKELVDKETPMKVNMEDYHLEDEYEYPIYNCAKCGKHLNDEDSYCRHCGQKLDWSDTND